MILGLTGRNASGKGTIANYFKKQGFQYYSLSNEVREVAKQQGIAPTRENLIKLANGTRKKHGNDYFAQKIIPKLEKLGVEDNAVVDSIRTLAEVNALKRVNGFFLIVIDAPIEARFERVKKRASQRDQKTLQEFQTLEEMELHGTGSQQQIAEVEKMADFTIRNDSDLKNLYKKSADTLKQIRLK